MAQRLEAETCRCSFCDSSLSINNYVDGHYMSILRELKCAKYVTRERSVGWMQRGCLEDKTVLVN